MNQEELWYDGAFHIGRLRIPLSNWQQIKILGLFEATRVKEEAKEEIRANRELEFNRLIRLTVLSNHEKGYKTVLENITDDGKVVADSLLLALLESIKNTYFEGNEKLVVHGGFSEEHDVFTRAPQMVKDLWMGARSDVRKAHRFSNGWESTILCAMGIGGKTFVIWLRSGEYNFDEIDEAFLLSVRNTMEHYVALAVADRKVVI